MAEELFIILKNKVQKSIETIELLKKEVSDLTNENNVLKEARSEWEQKLTDLIEMYEGSEEDTEDPEEETEELEED